MAFAHPGLPGGPRPEEDDPDDEVAVLAGQQLLDGNGDDALAENLRRIGLSSPAPTSEAFQAAKAAAAVGQAGLPAPTPPTMASPTPQQGGGGGHRRTNSDPDAQRSAHSAVPKWMLGRLDAVRI